jgi:membrane protease YdiL (CAAX protease family)
MTDLVPTNSQEAVQSRFGQGRIPRYGPLLMIASRSVFILIAQGLTYLLLVQLKVPNASVTLRNWWPVYGTLVDFACLGLMYWLVRREGIRLLDILDVVKRKLLKESFLGIGLFLLIFPIAMIGGGALAQLVAYGTLSPTFPQYTFNDRILPLLALIYARALWWPLWSATEEMTYNGYGLPRMIAVTKSRWMSVAIVSFFFALQHSFLMFAGWHFFFYMFLAFVPLAIAMVVTYMYLRRLPPLIVAHWLMDMSNVFFLYRVG